MGCSSSAPAINPDTVDLTHFRILKAIGRGGFGKVSAIESRKNESIFALKRLRKFQILSDPLNILLVWSERKVLQLVDSPFVVNVVHAFQSPTELFLVMPYLPGGDLRYHLNESSNESGQPKFDKNTAYFYARQLIVAMESLHKHNVILRDLKPENILISSKGSICLIDFGLAVIADDPESNTLRDLKAGTPGYLSPEMAEGDSNYSFEVDVWSWAVVFYEMLHGNTPWKDQLSEDHQVSYNELKLSDSLSQDEKSFFRSVFHVDRGVRLGGNGRWDEIKSHSIFRKTDWKQVESQSIPPPFVPDPQRTYFTGEAAGLDELVDEPPEKIPDDQQHHFNGWEFNVDVQRRRLSLTAGRRGSRDTNGAGAKGNAV